MYQITTSLMFQRTEEVSYLINLNKNAFGFQYDTLSLPEMKAQMSVSYHFLSSIRLYVRLYIATVRN